MLRIIFDKTPVKCAFENVLSIVTEKADPIGGPQFEKITGIMTIRFDKTIQNTIKKMLQERECDFLQELKIKNCSVYSAIAGNMLLLRYDDSLEIDNIHAENFTADLTLYAIITLNFDNKPNVTFRWKISTIE